MTTAALDKRGTARWSTQSLVYAVGAIIVSVMLAVTALVLGTTKRPEHTDSTDSAVQVLEHADPTDSGATNPHASHGQAHSAVEAVAPFPLVALDITADPHAGWNVHVKLENFRFTPQNAGSTDVSGEGHAHLYVNGKKIARLYAGWYHLAELPVGNAEVLVTLNTNDHRLLAINGTPIGVTRTMTVTAGPARSRPHQ
jgi:hypothetical protein